MISLRRAPHLAGRDGQTPGEVWGEDLFRFLLTSEQRRSKRSGNPFVLTILNAMEDSTEARGVLELALPVVVSSVRETDIVGWIEKPSVLAIIFTQLDSSRTNPNMTVVHSRLEKALQEKLGRANSTTIAVSSHVFTDPLETLQLAVPDSRASERWAVQ